MSCVTNTCPSISVLIPWRKYAGYTIYSAMPFIASNIYNPATPVTVSHIFYAYYTNGDACGDTSKISVFIISCPDIDDDNDGILDTNDNCPNTPNTYQADRDHDGLGDVCDTIEINASEAITPNGDGINDTWVIYNLANHPGSTVRVFNANGTQVFYSANYQNNWTGNYQGSSEMLPVGSYLYQIDLGGDGSIDAQGWLYITN